METLIYIASLYKGGLDIFSAVLVVIATALFFRHRIIRNLRSLVLQLPQPPDRVLGWLGTETGHQNNRRLAKQYQESRP